MLIFLSIWYVLSRWRLSIVSGLGMLVVASAAFAQPPSYPAEMLPDAELHAVHFVNADRGWAVGDRGAIWQTEDGGRTWRQQLSPVACRLDGVHFFNEQQGWAVGGWIHPYTHRTIGVVLRTDNGGAQWTSVANLTLPSLRAVKMLDARRGWAIGDASPMYPTGIFWTEDAGRAWMPVPNGPASSWTAAAMTNQGHYAACGTNGKGVHGTLMRAESSQVPATNSAPYLGIALDDQGKGWMVGAGGKICRTVDGGRSWVLPQGALPSFVREYDFTAVAMRGSQAWVVGSPGTLVFHTADDGVTWEAFPTDCRLPLQALTFIDDQRGWAVGTMGTILATRDGGQSWLAQRSGGSRAALMGIFSEARRVPWEWFGMSSGNDGYFSMLEILTSDANHGPDDAFRQRLQAHEALVAMGGCAAEQSWNLPAPPPEIASPAAIQQFWQQHAGEQAADLLEERLVKHLRQWRPEVVLTEDVSPRGEHPLGHLTNQMVLTAVQKAADPTSYPTQISLLGLEPWKVKKVVAPRVGETRGTFTLAPAQLAPRLGKSVAEVAEAGRSLVCPQMLTDTNTLAAAVLVDSLPQGLGRQDLFSGITVRPDSDARRRLSESVGSSLESLTRLSQKRYNIQQLIAHTQGNSNQAATWLAQVGSLTSGMSDRAAGEVLFQLGMRYQEAGKWDLASEALTMLVQTHPQHPLSEPASQWLLQYYTSYELAWREERSTKYNVQLATYDAPVSPLDLPLKGKETDTEELPPLSLPAEATTAQLNTDAAETEIAPQFPQQYNARLQKANAIARFIEQSRPALHAEPAIRFPLATILRRSGSNQLSQHMLEALQRGGTSWAPVAEAENWLLKPKGKPPLPSLTAQFAKDPPHLDGRMDDAVWQASHAIELRETCRAGQEFPTLFVAAYDAEYLYLAASCRRASGKQYLTNDAPRVHDADLTSHDRLELSLDVDRDYAVAYNLAVDHQGRPAESLASDKTWNPEWFVATSGDDSYWTLEAAIPWKELVGTCPQPQDAWGLTVRRVVPLLGTQTLTGADGPEFCTHGGLLLFSQPETK